MLFLTVLYIFDYYAVIVADLNAVVLGGRVFNLSQAELLEQARHFLFDLRLVISEVRPFFRIRGRIRALHLVVSKFWLFCRIRSRSRVLRWWRWRAELPEQVRQFLVDLLPVILKI